MRKKLEQRLTELKAEFGAGQKQLAELETRQANLRDTLLRISGAIQVLEEELGKSGENNGAEYSPQNPAAEKETPVEGKLSGNRKRK
jgi:uncharacterized coiled-coil protein SlyX